VPRQNRHRGAGVALLGLATLGSAAIIALAQPSAPPPDVAAACGGCHQVPPADVLPRSAWRDEM